MERRARANQDFRGKDENACERKTGNTAFVD